MRQRKGGGRNVDNVTTGRGEWHIITYNGQGRKWAVAISVTLALRLYRRSAARELEASQSNPPPSRPQDNQDWRLGRIGARSVIVGHSSCIANWVRDRLLSGVSAAGASSRHDGGPAHRCADATAAQSNRHAAFDRHASANRYTSTGGATRDQHTGTHRYTSTDEHAGTDRHADTGSHHGTAYTRSDTSAYEHADTGTAATIRRRVHPYSHPTPGKELFRQECGIPHRRPYRRGVPGMDTGRSDLVGPQRIGHFEQAP